MKTINDLVDNLNKYPYGEYYIKKSKAERYLLYKRYREGEDRILFDFSKEEPYWSIYKHLGVMHAKVQRNIMNFVYSTDREHWFDEPVKKYNLIIGKDVKGNDNDYDDWKTAYGKVPDGIEVSTAVNENSLRSDMFIFTESEIDDLKAKVSKQLAQIIDIAKVEVKNES